MRAPAGSGVVGRGPLAPPAEPRAATSERTRAAAVIGGWTEAMQLMVEGDKWEMYIPSDLGYGEQGSPPKIQARPEPQTRGSLCDSFHS